MADNTNRARTRAIRARMAATGEPYSRAARALAAPPSAPAGPAWATEREEIRARVEGLRGQPGRPGWVEVVEAMEAGWYAPVGGVTPPVDWPVWAGRWPHHLVLWRDRDGVDVLEVLTAADGGRLAALSVPHVPEGELLAAWEADGLLGVVGARLLAGLGRPDLLAHRLGWSACGVGDWYAWPDGSWRSPARLADTRHTVTATPLPGGRLRLVVVEHPDDWTLVDIDVPAVDDRTSWEALNTALDPHGYVVDHGLWTRLPGGVRYARARPGRLAERDWSTSARVRVVRETTVSNVDPGTPRTYRVGEVLRMHQSGRAGHEVDRRSWWTSYDIDGAHILPADAVEVLEVLEDRPPTWAQAALSADQITALLAPHHPGAAAAAAAWIAAGLHVAHDLGGLAIRTTPAGPRIGIIGRDYWNGDVHSRPYEAVLVDGERWERRTRTLPTLPLDPIAAADSP